MLFVIASACTAAWVGFAIWVSEPWREELERALGPVMGWVIPILLAYIPGLVIGFMCFTLVFCRYREPAPEPPHGPWPEGEWPPLTVVVAAWNEEDSIARTLEHIAATEYAGPVTIVLADNNSTDRTAELAADAATRLGLDYRRVFEPEPGKFHALNAVLETVTTDLVTTVDADTLLHPQALTYLVARVTARPRTSTSAPAPER